MTKKKIIDKIKGKGIVEIDEILNLSESVESVETISSFGGDDGYIKEFLESDEYKIIDKIALLVKLNSTRVLDGEIKNYIDIFLEQTQNEEEKNILHFIKGDYEYFFTTEPRKKLTISKGLTFGVEIESRWSRNIKKIRWLYSGMGGTSEMEVELNLLHQYYRIIANQ